MKLIIIGNSGCGKTNLRLRMTNNQFVDEHFQTIGIDFSSLSYTSLFGEKYKVNIFEATGGERFIKSIIKRFYSRMDGFIVCFDL